MVHGRVSFTQTIEACNGPRRRVRIPSLRCDLTAGVMLVETKDRERVPHLVWHVVYVYV